MKQATNPSSAPPTFDVFLSHNSRDNPIVERLAERLKRAGLEPWLDLWALAPGGRWHEELAAGMGACSACAYFVGPNGEGDWEREELAVALDRAATDRSFRTFPVLLPGVPDPFDRTTLPPFLSTRTWVDLRGGLDDTRGVQALINAIKGVPLGPASQLVASDDACPYRGLQTFDEAHADLFFGRDGDVQAILEQLKATRFLAILGPSGSGKSSLVRAGVIAALRRAALPGSDHWAIEIVRPGARPLEALAVRLQELDSTEGMQRTVDALASDERTLHLAGTLAMSRRPDAGRLAWIIDQTEELFTLCRDEAQRSQFIANLLYAASIPDGPSVVILTLRADFYARCADYPALSALLARYQYLVGPMDEASLRAAIEEPARAVGLEFESGLVDTILDDVASEPGRLPLLEHALLELWERRRGGMLTLEAYRESGGVQGAIAQRAETIYESFDPPRQAIARHAFLRLTQPGEGTEDTRRRATLREVAGRVEEEDSVEAVVRDLADARLLTTSADQQTGERWVDISHEALIRGWPRLRSWLDEDRTALRVHRRITEAAEEWERLRREAGVLYRGARLAEAGEWRTANEGVLNDVEREFLDASDALQKGERVRRERLRKGVTIAAIASALIFLVLAGSLANQVEVVEQERNATATERVRAEQQSQVALARQLAAQAGNELMRPDRALLLSLEANRLYDAVEMHGSLLSALTNTRLRAYLSHTEHAQRQVAFSPQGTTLASLGADGTIVLWDVATQSPIGEPLRDDSVVLSIGFSPNGEILASGTDDGTIVLWDVGRRTQMGEPLRGPKSGAISVAFSPTGATLASMDSGGTIVLWDVVNRVPNGEPLKQNVVDGATSVVEATSIAFSPNGQMLASTVNNFVVLSDAESRSPIDALEGDGARFLSVAYSPTGKVLAAGNISGWIDLWDVPSMTPIGSLSRGHTRPVTSVAFSPDGMTLASASSDNKVVLWDVASRAPIEDPLRGHDGAVNSVAFGPDGKTLASSSSDGTVVLWGVDSPAPIAEEFWPDDTVVRLAVSPDWSVLAAKGETTTDGTNIVLWDVAKRTRMGELVTLERDIRRGVFSPDGKTLAILAQGQGLVLWDVATRAPIGELTHDDTVQRVAFSPDGKTLAWAVNNYPDFDISLWDVANRAVSGGPLRHRDETLRSMVISPDGKTLAADTYSGIVLWDMALRAPFGEQLQGAYPAFSPDGKTLASVYGGTILLWDVTSQARIGELAHVHQGDIYSVAFSPDGTTLASGSYQDGTIVLWDVESQAMIGEPIRVHDLVVSVAFSPDGQMLASRASRTILWNVGRQAQSAAACRIANRNLSYEEWQQYLPTEPYHETCPGLPVPGPAGLGENP